MSKDKEKLTEGIETQAVRDGIVKLSQADTDWLKSNFKDVRIVQVKVGDEVYQFAFKKPGRHIRIAAQDAFLKKGLSKSQETIVRNTLLNGAKLYDSNDTVYFALNGISNDITEQAEVDFLP